MRKKKKLSSEGVALRPTLTVRTVGTYTIAILSLASVALLWQEPILLSLVLLGLSIILIGIGKDEVMTRFYLWITCGIAGAIAEYIAIQAGAWEYTQHEDTVPIWLPLLWGIAAIFIQQHSKGARRLPKVTIE